MYRRLLHDLSRRTAGFAGHKSPNGSCIVQIWRVLYPKRSFDKPVPHFWWVWPLNPGCRSEKKIAELIPVFNALLPLRERFRHLIREILHRHKYTYRSRFWNKRNLFRNQLLVALDDDISRHAPEYFASSLDWRQAFAPDTMRLEGLWSFIDWYISCDNGIWTLCRYGYKPSSVLLKVVLQKREIGRCLSTPQFRDKLYHGTAKAKQ